MQNKKFRKATAYFLFAATLMSAVFAGENVSAGSDSYAGENNIEPAFLMAEGFGTGSEFSDNSWNISTVFMDPSIESEADRFAKIRENEHSENNEKIIRLIDNISDQDLSYSRYDRAGAAFYKNKISMKDTSEFSAKFTISMPDACITTIGGLRYCGEAGGNGIAFVITPMEKYTADVDMGIGYENFTDSLVIEMDSYFNGAYARFVKSGNNYVNWAYDNQIFANDNLGFLQSLSDYTNNKGVGYSWDFNAWTTLNAAGYDNLSDNINRRFDHVGVTLNGNSREHLGISYLNGLKPDKVENGKYTNINDSTATTPSSSSDCATRFADVDVDNRLFTFWVEYDGNNLYIRYANGSFNEAARPSEPQILIEDHPDLSNIFANENVQIGFISSIGYSKAQHTVHSVAFSNKFFENGIKTEYEERYYVEAPEALDNYITAGDKKYVLKESVKADKDIGQPAEIRDKSAESNYRSYKIADYSDNPLYPSSVESVKSDGTTVLYQFYDLPQYEIEYWLEQDESKADTNQIGDKHYLKSDTLCEKAPAGSLVSADLNSDGKAGVTVNNEALSKTYKSFEGLKYSPETTGYAGHSEGTVSKDDSLVIRLYFDRITNPDKPTEPESPSEPESPTEPTDPSEPTVPPHTHEFGSNWITDSKGHHKECSCGEISEAGTHIEDNGTVTVKPTNDTIGEKVFKCSICGYVMRTSSIPPTDLSQGIFENDVQKEGNVPDAKFTTPIDKLAEAVLNDAEKELLKNGADVKISLIINDADNSVSEADRAAVTKALNGYMPGQYLDISLILRTGTENRKITSTTERIAITFTIPDKLKPNSETDRTFAVIRVHDGKAEVLNDMDNDDNTITIETDSFSTYAIVFYDESGEAPKPPVATGVKSFAAVLFALGAGALLMLVFIYFTTGRNGLSEEKKRRIYTGLIAWGKKGKKLRSYIALALIFLILGYYYSIGRKTTEDCRTI